MRKTWGKTLETIGQNNEWNSMRNTEKTFKKHWDQLENMEYNGEELKS
jgi:hypothetical protein